MDQTFQTTSFIPKKPIAQVSSKASTGMSIFNLVAGILLVGTLVFSGLTYVWEKQLLKEVENLRQILKTAQDKFDPYAIQNLQQLDRRINTAEKILDNHVTLSPILLNVLNVNTLKKVQYTQFTHNVSGTGTGAKIQVKLKGKAESLPYVALQSKKLAENQYVQNPIFSDIVTAKDNSVSFNLIFDLSPMLIVYSNLIHRLSQGENPTGEASPSSVPITNNVPSTIN